MILKGNQRSGGGQLATHLMNVCDNEHVTVHELRGFLSDDLHGAFNEAHAVSCGTRCKQYLFSLSLNPPETENVPIEAFESAISDIETKLGLVEQPRAIVFHEKEGRRHAHCVWSRIDVEEMKAINLPHYKLKLRDLSRELYLQHQWKMPLGLASSEERDPLNFTLEEWQQAKRAGVDPRKVKEAIQDAWAISDSVIAFSNALRERGFWLARGDKRGHVAVDVDGNVFAIARAVGVNSKDVRARLGDPGALPEIASVKSEIDEAVSRKLHGFVEAERYKAEKSDGAFQAQRQEIVRRQRLERQTLNKTLESRRIFENKIRAAQLPAGLKALWFRVTGIYRKLKLQNEQEAEKCAHRDRLEMARLVKQQLCERRRLRSEITLSRTNHRDRLKAFFDEISSRRIDAESSVQQTETKPQQPMRSPKRSRAP